MGGTSSFPSSSSSWAGISNIPDYLKENAEEERQKLMLQILNDIAENRAANNLNPQTYENLFFDAFVDSSKIASSSNVNITTGQNGNIKLDTGVIDNNNNQYNITSEDSWEVAHTYNTSRIINRVNATAYNSESGFAVYVRVKFIYSDGSDYLSSQNTIGDAGLKTVSISNPNPSKTVETVNVEFRDSGGNLDYLESSELIGLLSSGSVTYTVKSLDTPPDTIQVYSDYQDNGQTLEYVISDGNGNSKTVSMSEIGDSIDVSFTGTNMTVDLNFYGDGTETPILDEYGVDF